MPIKIKFTDANQVLLLICFFYIAHALPQHTHHTNGWVWCHGDQVTSNNYSISRTPLMTSVELAAISQEHSYHVQTRSDTILLAPVCPDAPLAGDKRAHEYVGSPSRRQCPGRFVGIIGQNPCVCRSSWFRVVIFWYLFIDLRCILYTPPNVIGNFLEQVLSFNQLLLKLTHFICN